MKVKVKVSQSCLTFYDPMGCSWNSPGQNTGMGRLSLLQEIFPTQRLNPGLPHCRWILYQLSYEGSPWKEGSFGKDPDVGERLKVGGDGNDREWDGWMASLIGWTWVWTSSRSWWWTGKPGVLQSMGSQRVGHDWTTELNWTDMQNLKRNEINELIYRTEIDLKNELLVPVGRDAERDS